MLDVISRFGDRRDRDRDPDPRGRRPDHGEIRRAVAHHFRRDADEIRDDGVVIDDVVLLHDPALEPPFVLVPECETCGRRDVDQFHLEQWTLLGAQVLGQSSLRCRDCRFRTLARNGTRRTDPPNRPADPLNP